MAFVERFSGEISKLKASNRAEGNNVTDGLPDLIDAVLDGRDDKLLFNPMFTIQGLILLTRS